MENLRKAQNLNPDIINRVMLQKSSQNKEQARKLANQFKQTDNFKYFQKECMLDSDENDLIDFFYVMKIQKYKKGEVIYHSQTTVDGKIYIVLKGEIIQFYNKLQSQDLQTTKSKFSIHSNNNLQYLNKTNFSNFNKLNIISEKKKEQQQYEIEQEYDKNRIFQNHYVPIKSTQPLTKEINLQNNISNSQQILNGTNMSESQQLDVESQENMGFVFGYEEFFQQKYEREKTIIINQTPTSILSISFQEFQKILEQISRKKEIQVFKIQQQIFGKLIQKQDQDFKNLKIIAECFPETHSYKQGDIIKLEGSQDNPNFYLIQQGSVALKKEFQIKGQDISEEELQQQQLQHTLTIIDLDDGEFFGFESFQNVNISNYTAVVLSENLNVMVSNQSLIKKLCPNNIYQKLLIKFKRKDEFYSQLTEKKQNAIINEIHKNQSQNLQKTKNLAKDISLSLKRKYTQPDSVENINTPLKTQSQNSPMIQKLSQQTIVLNNQSSFNQNKKSKENSKENSVFFPNQTQNINKKMYKNQNKYTNQQGQNQHQIFLRQQKQEKIVSHNQNNNIKNNRYNYFNNNKNQKNVNNSQFYNDKSVTHYYKKSTNEYQKQNSQSLNNKNNKSNYININASQNNISQDRVSQNQYIPNELRLVDELKKKKKNLTYSSSLIYESEQQKSKFQTFCTDTSKFAADLLEQKRIEQQNNSITRKSLIQPDPLQIIDYYNSSSVLNTQNTNFITSRSQVFKGGTGQVKSSENLAKLNNTNNSQINLNNMKMLESQQFDTKLGEQINALSSSSNNAKLFNTVQSFGLTNVMAQSGYQNNFNQRNQITDGSQNNLSQELLTSSNFQNQKELKKKFERQTEINFYKNKEKQQKSSSLMSKSQSAIYKSYFEKYNISKEQKQAENPFQFLGSQQSISKLLIKQQQKFKKNSNVQDYLHFKSSSINQKSNNIANLRNTYEKGKVEQISQVAIINGVKSKEEQQKINELQQLRNIKHQRNVNKSLTINQSTLTQKNKGTSKFEPQRRSLINNIGF